jgi:preprotein translocase subunit SecA
MINTILTKIFGSQHEREVKKMLPLVAEINEMEQRIKALSDDELRGKTAELKAQVASGEKTLDDILVPAFAVAREAAWRAVHMRPFDVQLRSRGRGSTSSPSTTTWPAATPTGWDRSTASSASPSA